VAWNGHEFVLNRLELAPPQYRFQAVQDGDRLAMLGDYARALDFYQQAIYDNQLDYWSPERKEQMDAVMQAEYEDNPTPTPPAPDRNEYPSLAAYARFRILLLHLLRGYLTEATTVYNTLLEKFPAGQPGHAFAEISQAFWEEYQVGQDMGLACRKAIDYAAAHPDILDYLGSYYHGSQSHHYQPEDICPFK
jgi:tetratricopeptide (TPR) repeat protein